LTSATDGGDLTVRVPPIVLTPPNLKVWATRRYQGQGLLKNSDEERNTISNEGSATTDDRLVEIHTEWLDQNGYPLPTGLAGYGYTGRLTKQIGNAGDGDPYDNSVTEFDINPGRQLQVLNFDNTPYHHYLQVNGYPSGEQNDFSAGDHTGVLRHRPAQYVPVRVPLYNEQGSIEDKLAVAAQDKDTRDLTPRFNWVYRSELSFSVVDLEVESIIQKNQDSTADSGNLLDDDIPAINNSYDLVEVIFNLIGSEYERITALDGEQQYIFALGDQEIEVRIDKGEGNEQQIQFTNLDYLSQLDVEDYLTLSLYLNQDAQNVLWEWGFQTLGVFPPELVDETIKVSADDALAYKQGIFAFVNGASDEQVDTVNWSTNGEGVTPNLQNSDQGLFATELTLPTIAGRLTNVSAELNKQGRPTGVSATFETIAGSPKYFFLTSATGSTSLAGRGEKRYRIQLTDQFGNPVEDATPVNIEAENLSINGGLAGDYQALSTVDGYVEFTVSGDYEPGSQLLRLTSGDAE